MPNRIIREGILTSDRVNSLSPAAELFYRRLMSVVDDFGRFDARLAILRVSCYPLRVNEVREADISRSLAECKSAGLIALYAVDGKQYLEMVDFRQTLRAKTSRYPPPSGEEPVDEVCDADATQVHSRCEADEAQMLPRSRSRSRGENQSRETKPSVAAAPLPPWLPADDWHRWVKSRGRKATPHAQELQLKSLDRLRSDGHDPITVINLAIESGWATFYPPKVNGPPGMNGKHRPVTQAEKRAATAAAMYAHRGEANEHCIDGQAERVD